MAKEKDIDQVKKGLKMPKLFGSKGGKDSKAVKAPKKASMDLSIQGFLIPKHYKNLSIYKNHPLFRSTLLIFLLTLVVLAIGGTQWFLASRVKTAALATQTLELEEAQRLQGQTMTLKPIRDKYRELEVLRRQLRVPLSPILDVIEKTIPPQISINRITANAPPIASTESSKRKIQIQAEVYFPEGINAEESTFSKWPETMTKNSEKWGLKISKVNWGPQRRFNPSPDQAKRLGEKGPGNVKELAFAVELSE